MLAAYAAVWTLYGVIAKACQDMQIDAAEIVAWSNHLALGYAKHSPLAAWLVRVWFTVFAIHDWSYYLFAILYATSGLWQLIAIAATPAGSSNATATTMAQFRTAVA